MPQKSETPHKGGASRNSCGGSSRDSSKNSFRQMQPHVERSDDLASHVRQFVPDCVGKELEQRIALLIARDFAAFLRGNVRTEMALEHAAAAHEMAGAFVFADVPTDRLIIAVGYCRNLVRAAFHADHLESEGNGE